MSSGYARAPQLARDQESPSVRFARELVGRHLGRGVADRVDEPAET